MDQSKCCICQKCTIYPLKCQLNINGTGDKSGPYGLFLHNVNTLRSLNSLPLGHKTTKRFFAMPINQAREQNNDTVKLAGGAVGLTENLSAFRK